MLSHNKLISQKPVFKAKLFTIKEDQIKLPNGELRTHLNIYRHPTSIVFPITDSNEVYLLKQFRYLYGKYIYEAVAGFIEEGETPLLNAQKELEEEAGIRASSWEILLKVCVGASVIKGEQNIFLARDLAITKPKREASEQIYVEKMRISDALSLVLKQETITASTMIGLLLLDKMIKEGKL